MEVFDDSSSSPSGTLRSYPLTCKVIYSYKASQPDELTIDEHEMLEVIEDGDMEDWVKARNKSGSVGYVPEKYLQFPASSSLLSVLSSLAALDARSHTSSNSTEPEISLNAVCVNGEIPPPSVHVRALYSYSAQTEEELSFPEGSVIRVLSRDNQSDDGFWEGELNGRTGVFPSLLVEELSQNGDSSAPAGLGGSLLETQKAALLPLPLYDQPPTPMMPFTSQPPTPMMPFTSPELCSPPPLPRSQSTNQNGEHKPLPLPVPAPHSRSPVSPGLAPPLLFTPDGGPAPGKLRPVRAAPPPPKPLPPRLRANEKSDKTEEVEITLV